MTPEQLLQECEQLSHAGRMQRMVELGRLARFTLGGNSTGTTSSCARTTSRRAGSGPQQHSASSQTPGRQFAKPGKHTRHQR